MAVGGGNRRVLVVDDEPSITEVVGAYLEKDGYHVYVAHNGTDAITMARRYRPVAIILDLMLPDLSGEQVCRTLRRESSVPIIMLTAKNQEQDKLAGLSLGADDYITKPFSPKELTARLRAVIRRTDGESAVLVDVLSFNHGELIIDVARHELSRNGVPIELTPTEWKILVTLARYPGRVYSRIELLDMIQGYDYEGFERTVDTHVKNLRAKVEADPKEPVYVQTVYGLGYKFGGSPDD